MSNNQANGNNIIEKLVEKPTLVLSILGAILLLVAAIDRLSIDKYSLSISSPYARLALGVIGITMILIGLFSFGHNSKSSLAGSDKPQVFTKHDLGEEQWLNSLIEQLKTCQSATVYLRYFRDPDLGSDQRLHGK